MNRYICFKCLALYESFNFADNFQEAIKEIKSKKRKQYKIDRNCPSNKIFYLNLGIEEIQEPGICLTIETQGLPTRKVIEGSIDADNFHFKANKRDLDKLSSFLQPQINRLLKEINDNNS